MSTRRPNQTLIGTAVAAIWAAIWAAGAVAAEAQSRRIELGFEFYGGGLHIASVKTESRLDADYYRIAAAVKTEGLLDRIVGVELASWAEGRLGPDGPTPARFESVTSGRWAGWRIKMVFADDGAVEAEVSPPPDQDGRDRVPPALRRGALDPLSAALLAGLFLEPRAACRRHLPVFDGRRRFDIVFAARGSETLKANEYGLFHGRALKCEVTARRIAGFKEKPPPDGELAIYTVWLARFEQSGLTLPVRLEAATKWGSVIGHLTRVKSAGHGDIDDD